MAASSPQARIVAPQLGLAGIDADQSRQRVRAPGQVTHQPHVVSHADCLAPQFTGLDGNHLDGGISRQRTGDSASVNSDHERINCIVVRRSLLAARSGTPPPLDAHVVLIELATAHAASSPRTSAVHICANSGMVFAVVPMFSTVVPGTRSPTIAPKVAIRWSW